MTGDRRKFSSPRYSFFWSQLGGRSGKGGHRLGCDPRRSVGAMYFDESILDLSLLKMAAREADLSNMRTRLADKEQLKRNMECEISGTFIRFVVSATCATIHSPTSFFTRFRPDLEIIPRERPPRPAQGLLCLELALLRNLLALSLRDGVRERSGRSAIARTLLHYLIILTQCVQVRYDDLGKLLINYLRGLFPQDDGNFSAAKQFDQERLERTAMEVGKDALLPVRSYTTVYLVPFLAFDLMLCPCNFAPFLRPPQE